MLFNISECENKNEYVMLFCIRQCVYMHKDQLALWAIVLSSAKTGPLILTAFLEAPATTEEGCLTQVIPLARALGKVEALLLGID